MNHDKKVSIMCTGGGTGGHIFPVKSLIEFIYSKPEFVSKCDKIFRCGLSSGLEKTVAQDMQDFLSSTYPDIFEKTPFFFVPISSGKFRREKNLIALRKNFLDLGNFLRGIFEAFFLLKKYSIDVVFCKGGFVALPVVIAARILKIKILVHESDTTPGIVNRVASRMSLHNITAFPKVLPHAKVLGQILSDTLFDDFSVSFSVDTSKTIVLVTGGSQGAQKIYQTLYTLLQNHGLSEFVFLMIGGTQNTHLKTMFEGFSNVQVIEFASQKMMGALYRMSDLALTRGGTTSLAEQKYFGIKSLIIPLPWTHDQLLNAKRYHHHHNDVVLLQDEYLSKNMLDQLHLLKGYKKSEISYEQSLKAIQHTKTEILHYLIS